MTTQMAPVRALAVAAMLLTSSGPAGSRDAASAAEMNEAGGGDSITAVSPRDLKDVPIAAGPTSRSFRAVAANPKSPRILVLLVQRASTYLAYRSADAGRSWSEPVPLPQQPGSFCCRASGDLAYAADGRRLYAAYTQFEPETGLKSIVVSASEDDGASWAAPTIAFAAQDHTGYAGPRIATGAGGADQWVYLTGRIEPEEGPGLGIVFTRSGDRGTTWSEPRGLVGGNVDVRPVTGGAVAAGRDGQVLVTWYNPSDFCSGNQLIEAASSQDHGATFAAPVTAAADPSDPYCIGAYGVDVKIGAKGVAHLVYPRAPLQPGEDDADVGYVWSPPPFTSWSQPLTVNDDRRPHTQVLGALAVEGCGAATVLHLVWQDPRLTPTASPEARWDVFYARKVARADAPWSKNIRVSGKSSSLWVSMVPGVAATRGRVFAGWTDNRAADPDAPRKVFGSGILSGVTCP